MNNFVSSAFPYFELGLYDVQHQQPFQDYVQKLFGLSDRHTGNIVAATKNIKSFSGARMPNYITASQWLTEEQFWLYQKEGDSR